MSEKELFQQMEHDDMFVIIGKKNEIEQRKQQPIEWTTTWEDNELDTFMEQIKSITQSQPK